MLVKTNRYMKMHGETIKIKKAVCITSTMRLRTTYVHAVLTHLLSQDPRLWLGVDLYQNRRRTHQQHHQVRYAEVHQEDVGRIAHVLRLEDHDGHHDVPGDADAHDHEAEYHGRNPDVPRDDGHLGAVPKPLNVRAVREQIPCHNGAVVGPRSPNIGSLYCYRRVWSCVNCKSEKGQHFAPLRYSPCLYPLDPCPCEFLDISI